jgi:uncharacterized membrane protein YfcA
MTTGMSILLFTTLVGASALTAGFLGALTGLGGGVVLVPVLTILFHVDIRYAIGASLVSVIATSSGAAAAYVREGFSNIRIGMFLEIATTAGAVFGAFLALHVSTAVISLIFGAVLIYSAAQATRHHESAPDGPRKYCVQHVPAGFLLMGTAGALSGLLGIGSGAVKVLAMDRAMQIPFKVSTTTSNFMIGVTAAASAGVYLSRGYIDPGIAMPVMLGVLAGSLIGARVLVHASTRWLRLTFAVAVGALGIEMIHHGLSIL